MKNRLNEMKVKWHTFILRVNERRQELAAMNRQMDRLKMVSLLATQSLTSSEDALNGAETILNRVTAMTRKIKEELRSRANELKSFGPEELGNIPRKLTEARRIMANVQKQAMYLSRRQVDIDDIQSSTSD